MQNEMIRRRPLCTQGLSLIPQTCRPNVRTLLLSLGLIPLHGLPEICLQSQVNSALPGGLCAHGSLNLLLPSSGFRLSFWSLMCLPAQGALPRSQIARVLVTCRLCPVCTNTPRPFSHRSASHTQLSPVAG